MKKLSKLILAIMILFSVGFFFTACGGSKNPPSDPPGNNPPGGGGGDSTAYVFSLLDDNTYGLQLVRPEKAPETLDIPSTYNGAAVTRVLSLACSSDRIKTINIPDSVTVIEEQAFTDCSEVTTLNIGNGVTEIGDEAFAGLNNAQTINFGSRVQSIGRRCFVYAGTSGEGFDLNFPNTLEEIGEEAFYHTGVKSVNFGTGMETVGIGCFDSCYTLNKITAPSIKDWCEIEFEFMNDEGLHGHPVLQGKTFLINNQPVPANIVIPANTQRISDYAFAGFESIQSITVAEGVSSIGYKSFYNNTNLKTVKLPASLNSSGGCNFWGSQLEELECHLNIFDYDYGTDYGIEYLGASAYIPKVTILGNGSISSSTLTYVSCDNLVIGPEITAIGEQSFSNTNISSVTIGNNVTTIGGSAFSNCNNLVSIVLGNKVETLGGSAFAGCDNLETVDLKNVKTIGSNTFADCPKIKELHIPATTTSLGYYAFKDLLLEKVYFDSIEQFVNISKCRFIDNDQVDNGFEYDLYIGSTLAENVVVPSSVTEIEEKIFSNIKSIKSLVINSTDITLKSNYATKNSNLTSLSGPVHAFTNIASDIRAQIITAVVTSGTLKYNNSVFGGYTTLANVTFADDVVANEALTASQGYPSTFANDSRNVTSLTCSASIAAYTKQLKKLETVVITSGTTILADTFHTKTTLTSLTLNSGLKTIEARAFYKLPFTSITLPNSVETIGENAFTGSSLESITLPTNLTTLGNNAFSGSTNLSVVNYNSAIETIGTGVFYNTAYQSNTATLTLPNSLVTIGDEAFKGFTALETLVIGSNTKNIGNYAFDDCLNLTSITLGDSVEYIGYGAFVDATLSYTTYNNVNYLGSATNDYAFAVSPVSKTGTSLSFHTNTKIISDSFARSWTTLETVTIPAGVKHIQSYTFNYCTNLNNVTFATPENIISIEAYAFSYTGSISIPKLTNLETLGQFAFVDSKITSIDLGDKLTTIQKAAFNLCDDLVSVTMPNTVETIEEYAFSGCTELASITLSENLVTIETYAFFRCPITSIVIPENVTTIETKSFEETTYNGTGLATVTVESAFIYEALTSATACGSLIEVATTIKVLKTVVDNAVNSFLNGTAYTKSSSGDYYIFTKV